MKKLVLTSALALAFIGANVASAQTIYSTRAEAVAAFQQLGYSYSEYNIFADGKGGYYIAPLVAQTTTTTVAPAESTPAESTPAESTPAESTPVANDKEEPNSTLDGIVTSEVKDPTTKDGDETSANTDVTTIKKALEILDQGLENREHKPTDGTLIDVDAETAAIEDTELPLENSFPTQEKAEKAAKEFVGQNPSYSYSVIQTADGWYVQYTAKLAVVRPLEQVKYEGMSFRTHDEAKEFGKALQGKFNNLGFDIVVNTNGTYSVRLFNKEYTPAAKPDVQSFIKVTDARDEAEKNVGPNQYYEIIETKDGRFAIRYYNKVALRDSEKKVLEDAKFTSEKAAKEVANEYKRVIAGLKTKIILDADGFYRIQVLEFTPEGELAIADNNLPATQKPEANSDKAEESEGSKEVKGNKPAKEEKADKKEAKLPETGETSSFAIYGAAVLSVLAGLGFVSSKRQDA